MQRRPLALALALQLGFAFLAHRALRARNALLLAALEPARCALLLTCWLLACASRRVAWRGHGFTLGHGSQLVPINAEAGTNTFSNTTSLKSLAPERSVIGRIVIPGSVRSTSNWLVPLCRSLGPPLVRQNSNM